MFLNHNQARPSYEAAKFALAALDDQANSDLGELKSYRAPPATVKWVVGALCVLFDRPDEYVNTQLNASCRWHVFNVVVVVFLVWKMC